MSQSTFIEEVRRQASTRLDRTDARWAPLQEEEMERAAGSEPFDWLPNEVVWYDFASFMAYTPEYATIWDDPSIPSTVLDDMIDALNMGDLEGSLDPDYEEEFEDYFNGAYTIDNP